MKRIHLLVTILLMSIAASITFIKMNDAFDLGHKAGIADQILMKGHCDYRHNGELVK